MALDFDGTDDFVDFGDVLDVGDESFTCMFWIKTSAAEIDDVTVRFVQKRGTGSFGTQAGWQISRTAAEAWNNTGVDDGEDVISIESSAANNDALNAGIDGTWHHYAFIWDNPNQQWIVILDGVDQGITSEQVAGTGAVGSLGNARSLSYGAALNGTPGATSQHIDARFAHIALFIGTVLTEAQVQSLMHRRLFSSDLVDLYTPLDEQEGSTVHDYKQVNDGTITGAAWAEGPPVTPLTQGVI